MKQIEVTTKRKVKLLGSDGEFHVHERSLTYSVTEFETLREVTDACDGDKRLVALANWGWRNWMMRNVHTLLGKNTEEETRKKMANALPPGDLPQTQMELAMEGVQDFTQEEWGKFKVLVAQEDKRRLLLPAPAEEE